MSGAYKRILVKVSGEYLGGEKGVGFDAGVINSLSEQICKIHDMGIEVAIVVGGGNIFRGGSECDIEMDRVAGDHMGMMATVINSICLQEALERHGMKTRVLTGIEIREVAEPYVKRRAVRHLEKGRIVIFGGGTGNPYFSTDTAAVLRGKEVKAEIVIKATKVDGVYDKDPMIHDDAKMYDYLSFQEVLEKDLRVMDSTAISFCREHSLPIVVLNMGHPTQMMDFIHGKKVGTHVDNMKNLPS